MEVIVVSDKGIAPPRSRWQTGAPDAWKIRYKFFEELP
jgi:hypothetical protein